MFRRFALALIISTFACASVAFALQSDELLLVVNGNVPASVKIAEFYAKGRLIPDGRILKLNLPGSEEIPLDRYEREVVPAVRDFLRKNQLESKVRCLVFFYGVPFRIGARNPTQEENAEVAELRTELTKTLADAMPFAESAEKLAVELQPGFVAQSGTDLQQMSVRVNHALQTINRNLPPPADERHTRILPEVIRLMSAFSGEAQIAAKVDDKELLQLLPEDKRAAWPARRKQLEANQKDIDALQDQRFDFEARKKLRKLVADGFGVFGYASLLQGQIDYLSLDGTVSSFDNEMSLLWWNFYGKAKQQPNPLNFHFEGSLPQTLMTCRLDGPQEGTAMQIILASLKAEREGLKGRIVIDSTNGTGPGGVADHQGGYRAFDDKLLVLARIAKEKTNFLVTLDRSPNVMPANTVKDVALYCGWYSVRNYVPACQFKVGAVGYHVASFEMVSLRADNEKGWVAGLLNDGVAATVGAVAEPYLSAFPAPEEFFPLLMTGKLTLAEVYWRTLPNTSWMMCCVGDPLYTPFKVNPLLKPEDLPPLLRRALDDPVSRVGG